MSPSRSSAKGWSSSTGSGSSESSFSLFFLSFLLFIWPPSSESLSLALAFLFGGYSVSGIGSPFLSRPASSRIIFANFETGFLGLVFKTLSKFE